MKIANRIANHLRTSLVLRVIIFCVALLHLISTSLWVARWYREFGAHPGDFYPDVFLITPFLLVLASGLLLVGRWWGYLPAFALSGWLLYTLGYGGLRAVSNAHDQPLLSFYVPRVWFMQKYVAQPQEFLELFLALVIMGFVVFALARRSPRKYA